MEHLADRQRRHLRERHRGRMRSSRLPERGFGDLRAALVLPLFEMEALSIDIHHTWQVLFPDTAVPEDASDVVDCDDDLG